MAINKPKVKILVVDDFPTMRKIVINLLKEIGYVNFDQAEDGEKALTSLRSRDFDFVVSDWNMPNMTGLDLLKNVRKDPHLKEMPFLLITAEAKRSQILEAAEAGTDGYIVKPFTAATLLEKMEKIVARREDYLRTKNLWI
jgi:two-component system chemotaxis response regulator CheY